MFCAEKIARFHDAVLAAGTWAVSVLDEDAEKTARWLATRGRPLDGQLAGIAHHPGPQTGSPVLDDALGAIERPHHGGARRWRPRHRGRRGGRVSELHPGAPADPLRRPVPHAQGD